MNVYTVTNRLRAFVFFFSISLILISGSLLLVPFITLPTDSKVLKLYSFCCSSIYLNALIVLLILTVVIFCAALLIDTFKRRVIFTSDAIISKNIFSTRKLKFNDIKGYKTNHFMLYIITDSNEKRRIAVNLFSLDRVNNLMRNLEIRFTNLDF